jgi:hypothetical protein
MVVGKRLVSLHICTYAYLHICIGTSPSTSPYLVYDVCKDKESSGRPSKPAPKDAITGGILAI